MLTILKVLAAVVVAFLILLVLSAVVMGTLSAVQRMKEQRRKKSIAEAKLNNDSTSVGASENAENSREHGG